MIFPTSQLNTYFEKLPLSFPIISVWGDFGVGKTTFALQTTFNTIGNETKSIYIYTKPSFPYDKINKISKASKINLESISFINIGEFNDLHSLVFNLEFLILNDRKRKAIQNKFIVIDSLTDLYRLALNREKKDKNYILNYNLNQILANLHYLNETYNVEILVINEKVQSSINDNIVEFQSGGKVMEYWVSLDIKIERTGVLKERKFVLTNRINNDNLEFLSTMTEKGFQ